MNKRILSMLLAIVLLLSMASPVFAEETEEQDAIPTVTVKLHTLEDFLDFAEKCRMDSYSKNLVASLEADIDLSNTDFSGIPIFSGTFEGNGHSITGLSLTADGSAQGLFRYLTETAVVQNLALEGSVHPGGSRNQVGAIAGVNAGQILNCTFTGSVSGGEQVGGIAGCNSVTGIIADCLADGDIYGNHFVGGVAGDNAGVVRGCKNNAEINTTPQQNTVEISDITMDSLTNSEAANTVTDIGGITGISSGVIRSCINYGNVGYRHMGYNVGGITGTQSGYIVNCRNHAAIQGRKEVGGIAGQMEPVSLIVYTEDTLQILQDQLNTMSGMVNRASSNAQSNAGQISGQIGVLQDQAQTAKDALNTLLPGGSETPDADAILAAQNTLSSTLNAMPGTLSSIASATQNTVNGLTRDLQGISGQISAMGQTISDAEENLGGSIIDVSDEDTDELLSGKIADCTNYGSILADLNAGGIAGAMAMENDLDILEDWEQSGENSLNFQSEVRTVVTNCQNLGTVTGSKQNIGGIAGWQSMGLVKNCTNTGAVDGTSAEYVGGIAGLSAGYIRKTYAKCALSGSTYLGGIAGSAAIVTDSRAMIQFSGGSEKVGAILGHAQEHSSEEAPITGNFYFSAASDPGAIDGISYKGLAEPLNLKAFLALEELPALFQTVTVRFLFEDGTEERISVAPGGKIGTSQIPAVPKKDGYEGKWDGIEAADFSNILFDLTFEPVYTAYDATIQSAQTRENGLPLLLAEGSFTDEAVVTISQSSSAPATAEGETCLESWAFRMTESGHTGRFLLPEDADPEQLKLLLGNEAGQWRAVEATVDGSYLVFALNGDDTTLALMQSASDQTMLITAGIAAAVLLIVLFFLLRKNKTKK